MAMRAWGRGGLSEDPISNAMTTLHRKTVTSPEFCEARKATVREIAAMVPDLTTDRLKELGGFTALIRTTMEKHCAGKMGYGSQLLPPRPLHLYLDNVLEVRNEIIDMAEDDGGRYDR